MKIDFTSDQYENLVKLAYLGNWVINAIRSKNDQIREFDDLEQHIFSSGKEEGLDKYIEYRKEFKKYYPTRKLEEDAGQYLDEYSNEIFWEELTYRLARRDFIKKYGKEEVKKMSLEELIVKEHPFVEKYADEFEKKGIANLVIKK